MIDEILVHISTPATKQNDELYHSVANAYLEFEPGRVIQSQFRQRQNEPDQPSGSDINSVVALSQYSSSQAAVDTSILSTSKDSYGSFPSYISSEDQAKAHEQASASKCGSSENDSLPPSSRLAQLERIHTKWKQRIPPRPNFLDGSDDADTAFIEDTQLAVQALQSQLLDTYSATSEDTSEDEPESKPEPTFEQHHPVVIENHQQSNNTSTSDVPGPATLAAFAKFRPVNAEHSKNSTADDTTLISNYHNRTIEIKKALLDSQKSSSNPLDFIKTPIDAYPPAPDVSVAASGTLPSQVTKYLASIKVQNPTRFKPSKKLRSPKSDDRGYWLCKCSEWPSELQLEFWSALHDHVATGRLGWGTTLHRESESPQTLGLVKLYCWGEVIEHMWLVLWLCSKGRVSGSVSKWIDADGVAVLEVP